jgi:hypothetical protein
MILYHGSNIVIQNPVIMVSNRMLDFGEGFYTTSDYEQAKRWAERVCDRRKATISFVCYYSLDLESAKETLRIVEFKDPNYPWLDFVTSCRSGRNPEAEYDIAIGPIANDTVYTTIQLYETGVLDADETIKRLKVLKTGRQYLFHTKMSLAYCRFVDFEKHILPAKMED